MTGTSLDSEVSGNEITVFFLFFFGLGVGFFGFHFAFIHLLFQFTSSLELLKRIFGSWTPKGDEFEGDHISSAVFCLHDHDFASALASFAS